MKTTKANFERLEISAGVAVIIPAYKAASHIVEVVRSIPDWIDAIIVVDDFCPENTGRVLQDSLRDDRIKIIYNKTNLGVGGAMVVGYQEALKDSNLRIFVKMDADGQMDPSNLNVLLAPIWFEGADYSKGSRFDSIEDLEQMPKLRIVGNATLSLMSKISSGYWGVNDPTNGYTAITRQALERIKLQKIRAGFFFESDMLFRLYLVNALVVDVPMAAKYGNEVSNLRIGQVILEFPRRYFVNFIKRILYRYYLKEWTPASFELPVGIFSLIFGVCQGFGLLLNAYGNPIPATAGEVMSSALPLILGGQLLLAFLNYDVASSPSTRHIPKL